MGDSVPVFKVMAIHPGLKPPKQSTEGSAGFDLYMPDPGHIPAGDKVSVGLGFSSAIPKGYVGKLYPRSGVGSRVTLELANSVGIMDADFRGEWVATLRTKDGQAFSWEAGERLIQLVIVKLPEMEMELVERLDETERGEGGHGSTGA